MAKQKIYFGDIFFSKRGAKRKPCFEFHGMKVFSAPAFLPRDRNQENGFDLLICGQLGLHSQPKGTKTEILISFCQPGKGILQKIKQYSISKTKKCYSQMLVDYVIWFYLIKKRGFVVTNFRNSNQDENKFVM